MGSEYLGRIEGQLTLWFGAHRISSWMVRGVDDADLGIRWPCSQHTHDRYL